MEYLTGLSNWPIQLGVTRDHPPNDGPCELIALMTTRRYGILIERRRYSGSLGNAPILVEAIVEYIGSKEKARVDIGVLD